MVLILAPSDDISTLRIIDELLSEKINYIRFSEQTRITGLAIDIVNDNIELECKDAMGNFIVDLNNIKFFYYRSGKFIFDYSSIEIDTVYQDFEADVRLYLKKDLDSINDFLFHLLFLKPHLGITPLNSTAYNKLTVLECAKKVNLKIPDSYIIDATQNWPNIKPRVHITKSITDIFRRFRHGKAFISKGTEIIAKPKSDISFFPSLIQNKIENYCDVKVILIYEELYACGIKTLPSKASGNHVDYRRLNNTEQLTYFNLALPKRVQKKINQLKNILNINWGVFDFIIDANEEYYFLELNPYGQFHQLAKLCSHDVYKRLLLEIKKNH